MSRRRATDPTRAVAYLRTSTSEQTQGLVAQREAIAAWAEREGVEVVAWHEEHVSGGVPVEQRPALSGALGDLVKHRAGLLVARCRDRFARDVAVAAALDAATARLGARLATADGLNGDDAGSEALRGLLDVVARMERRLISARTTAVLASKRNRGERTGSCPYGYTSTPDGRLVADPREVLVIDRVMELRRAGHPPRRVAELLDAEGVTWQRSRSKRLTEQTVSRIVRSQTQRARA